MFLRKGNALMRKMGGVGVDRCVGLGCMGGGSITIVNYLILIFYGYIRKSTLIWPGGNFMSICRRGILTR